MKKLILLLVIPILSIILGCSEDTDENQPTDLISKEVASCEGCHTNYTYLKEVYTPDPPSTGGGGCGGETPHIEPYDRVFMGGAGYEDFKSDIHAERVKLMNIRDGETDVIEPHPFVPEDFADSYNLLDSEIKRTGVQVFEG